MRRYMWSWFAWFASDDSVGRCAASIEWKRSTPTNSVAEGQVNFLCPSIKGRQHGKI